MKKVVISSTGVIIAISDIAEIVGNGILCDDGVIGISVDDEGNFVGEIPSIIDVADVPLYVQPGMHKLVNNQFIENENHIAAIPLDIQIAELKLLLEKQNVIIDDMAGLLAESGVI